jgi:pimeloyl-ACP methyl ester carboxylesterase
VSSATLADLPLPPLDPAVAPWPGRIESLPSGQDVYVRHTAGAGEHGASLGRAVHVHGLGGSSTNWTDLAALLSPYVTSDAIDLPGFGRSPAPVHGWSQAGQISVLIDYLEHTGAAHNPIHLVANSMGGAIAIVVAATRPDLVSTLTLVSPAVPDLRLVGHLRRSPMPMPLLLVPGLSALAERQLARMPAHERVAGTVRLCFADPGAVSESRLREAIAELEERHQLPWARRSGSRALRGLALSYLRRGRRSLWTMAASIEAPALVVWGTADRLVDVAHAPRLAAAIPDARLLVLPDAGHVAMMEQPVVVARAVLGLMQDAVEQDAR